MNNLPELIANLKIENHQLQQRIDKAIEYIESKYVDDYNTCLVTYEIDSLLEILKGDNNE